MKKLTYTLLITFISLSGWSQSEQLFTHYMFNRLNYNPAYAGSKEVLDAVAIYRNQWWSGIDGSPKTVNVNAHMPFARLSSGIGINFIWDKIGLDRVFSLGASYAYRIRFNKDDPKKKSVLAIGLNARFEGARSDWAQANEAVTAGDPKFGDVANSKSTFNVGPGIYFNNRHFYLGAAIPRLLANSLYADRNNYSGKVNTYYLQGGAGITVAKSPTVKKVELLPNLQIRINPNAPFDLDANLNVMFFEQFWIGANYRKDDSLDGLIGYQFTNGLKIGFAMDFTTSDLNEATTGSFEVMLGYTFPCEDCKIKNLRYF
ncbi:MAG: type IX secretion system membrane protein PorP/SprF [Saprospiraceae bacterium]